MDILDNYNQLCLVSRTDRLIPYHFNKEGHNNGCCPNICITVYRGYISVSGTQA